MYSATGRPEQNQNTSLLNCFSTCQMGEMHAGLFPVFMSFCVNTDSFVVVLCKSYYM